VIKPSCDVEGSRKTRFRGRFQLSERTYKGSKLGLFQRAGIPDSSVLLVDFGVESDLSLGINRVKCAGTLWESRNLGLMRNASSGAGYRGTSAGTPSLPPLSPSFCLRENASNGLR